MWPFYLYGRLIAVLEQGARAHGEGPWLEQYYPWGFFPAAGLREPLERHRQSVLNYLTRRNRAATYLARLDWLASALDNTENSITFDTWASRYLSYNKDQRPEDLEHSTPKDAPLYAQGYLDERIELQPNRPALPQDGDLWQFCWDYHQGRHLTFNIAGNDPGLPRGPNWASPTAGRGQRPAEDQSKPTNRSRSQRLRSTTSTDDADILHRILPRHIVPGILTERPAQELRNNKARVGRFADGEDRLDHALRTLSFRTAGWMPRMAAASVAL